MFAGVDDQSVEFVEELGVVGEGAFEEGADFVVAEFGRSEGVAFEDAAGVGVNDEHGMVAGIEKDGVGGFGADAVDGEELGAESFGGSREHASERAGVIAMDEAREGFQFFGFLTEVAGRADELREARSRTGMQGVERKEFFTAKIGNGALDIFPGSVLREDGADDDFEASAARPPVLWAVCRDERFVICFQYGQGRSLVLPRNSGDKICQVSRWLDRL